MLTRSKYSAAEMGGTGPISATLMPPGEDLPFEPSVNSQTLPAASALSAVGPAAACAWASVGKVSIRQNNCSGGNCEIFLSAIGFISNRCAQAGDDASVSNGIAARHRRNVRKALGARRDIASPLAFVSVASGSAAREKFTDMASVQLFGFRFDVQISPISDYPVGHAISGFSVI
jgi:hypothetical protein